jgi:hypothetical protein
MSKAREIAELGAVYDSGALSNRNLIINGAMKVSQRGTSFTGVTASAYHLDRFQTELTTLGTWTVTQESDGPDGFAHSLKYDCTTADASPASGDAFRLSYKFEGQDLQNLQKGTSSAKDCTLSFYIKSNKTGTGQFNIRDIDNNRGINKTYTINAANTWEYKTITIQGDTTGAISNDNGSSFWLMWVFNSGTGNSSGTFNSDWHTWDWTDINASGTLAIGGSTSDYIQITGVQLEVGTEATPFEHRSFGDELARCQRYYQFNTANTGYTNTTTSCRLPIAGPQSMRATPSISIANGTGTVEDYGVAGRNLSSLASLSGGTTLGGFVDATISTSRASLPHGLFPKAIAMDAEL